MVTKVAFLCDGSPKGFHPPPADGTTYQQQSNLENDLGSLYGRNEVKI
ncbi:MAG: hypothetical protein HC916_18395 [Coleofasciculaceae cyanobacterium SM2_1_6]|nr:hypothetical protein [Coleofasciculaceae cyanobacterium SM2_1_6]